MHRFAMIAFIVAGCAGDKDPADSGTDSGTAACPGGAYSGPITITSHSVGCGGGTTVTFDVTTDGVTGGGWVFSQETGNADDPYDQWSDTHTLDSVGADADCNTDHLSRTLDDVTHLADPLVDWQIDQSTVFGCATHYESPGPVMSYAFGVADATGALVTCAAYGEDVAGMLNGTYNRANPPDFDLSGCDDMGTMAR